MATSTQTDAEFWRGVLTAGTFTAIPRWSGDRVPGTAEYRRPYRTSCWHRCAGGRTRRACR